MNEFDEVINGVLLAAGENAERKLFRAERDCAVYVGPITGPMHPSFSESQKQSFIKSEQDAAVNRLKDFLHGVAINGAP